MKAIDDLLLNILILTVPILLYHIFWLDNSENRKKHWEQPLIGIMCSLVAIFCMTHPFIDTSSAHAYDLRVIPVMLAFLYGGIGSGLLVTVSILGFGYYKGEPFFEFMLPLFGLLVPLSLTFMKLTQWKKLTPKVMFPSLLALLGSLTIIVISLFSRLADGLPITLHYLVFGLFYCLFHTLTMWLITYLIERIKENLAIRQEVHNSEKLHVLSELAASVAHEIRNPMTVARGFMQILSQPHITDDKKLLYTTMVIEEIDRAQSIINDYLSFAKPQAEKLENLDTSKLMLKLTNLISPFAALRDVQIVFEVEPSLWVYANSEKMIQCLVNLTKNGIEAMPNGGILHITGYKKDTKVILEIRDQGVGMSQDQIKLLGTPFYSTKNKGTGLGMMVSYRIIKTFSGSIEVSSEPGKGTCFSVLIPAIA